MADFSDALDLALEALARRGPAGGDAVLAAMRPLLLAAGPVPSRGPLTHDLVVPGAAVGANVFEHGRALGLDAALHGFATGLGRGPEAASLLGEPGTSWAGGLLRRPGETRLKLYRVAPEPPLGVDLTARGPERWRRYVPPFPLDWPGAEWPPPQPGAQQLLVLHAHLQAHREGPQLERAPLGDDLREVRARELALVDDALPAKRHVERQHTNANAQALSQHVPPG